MLRRSLPLFCLLLLSPAMAQPTQYITDKVYAPVRSEPGEKGKVVHNGLESGIAVTVLEKNDQAGYARIRTSDGIEGWVRSQFLGEAMPASLQLEQANAQLAQLHTEKAMLEEELVKIKQISSSQIDTHERNIELVKQNQLLISEKEVLLTDNERLKNRNNQTWFLYGGLLVAVGALLTALLGKLGKKRRSDGWA